MSVLIKDMDMPVDCLACRISCKHESYRVTGRPDGCPATDAGDLINRAELFNRLAVVHAPVEANEYKAEVYRIINEL